MLSSWYSVFQEYPTDAKNLGKRSLNPVLQRSIRCRPNLPNLKRRFNGHFAIRVPWISYVVWKECIFMVLQHPPTPILYHPMPVFHRGFHPMETGIHRHAIFRRHHPVFPRNRFTMPRPLSPVWLSCFCRSASASLQIWPLKSISSSVVCTSRPNALNFSTDFLTSSMLSTQSVAPTSWCACMPTASKGRFEINICFSNWKTGLCSL